MKLRRILCVALCLLLPLAALAELELPRNTMGQATLCDYIAQVDACLAQNGIPTINSCFGCFETLAVFGITQEDNAEIPEDIELTFSLYQDSLNSLELRVSDPDAFTYVAAACLLAADEGLTWDDALHAVYPYTQQVKAAPGTSFEDTVVDMNGDTPRAYFAYYPDQYKNGVNWLQMTLIFPVAGSTAGLLTTPQPQALQEDPDGYNDIHNEDTFIHLETSATPTPDPESPAGEWLTRGNEAPSGRS